MDARSVSAGRKPGHAGDRRTLIKEKKCASKNYGDTVLAFAAMATAAFAQDGPRAYHLGR